VLRIGHGQRNVCERLERGHRMATSSPQ
jgi:hypothetical protein